MWVKEDELNEVQSQITQLDNPQLTIILYHVPSDHPNYYDFPVNMLRNICIRTIQTSHFMFLDVDMWPSRIAQSFLWKIANLYHSLMSLPMDILENDRAAVVIPPIFLNAKKFQRKCSLLEDCFSL